MDHEQRTLKDIEKLRNFIDYFKKEKLDEKYPELFDHALNYKKDAEYYFEKKDYFSSFGSANYSYGILEGLLFLEKGKYFHEVPLEPPTKKN